MLKYIFQNLRQLILVFLLLAIGQSIIAENSIIKMIVLEPKLTQDAVVNPGKGWVGYGSVEKQPKEVLNLITLGYKRYIWGTIEPKEGKYDWSIIDNDIKEWADNGKKFSFGIMCANTHSKEFWTTPKWVFDAGAKYETFNLDNPKLITTGIPGLKLVPVFDDSVYLQKLKVFIKALAKRYDGNPNIAYIDIRSYGNWGEGHMYPFNKLEITAEKYLEHIKIYRDAFQKTQLELPGGNKEYLALHQQAVSMGVGLRRDGICGNGNGLDAAICDGKMPVVFEFYGDYEMMEKLGWWYGKKDNQGRGFTLESCIENGKPTYCDLSRGGNSGLLLLKKEPELIKKLNNRLGYHFVINKATFPEKLSSKKENLISVTWENRGVTQIYFPIKVVYALISNEGKIVSTCDADVSRPAEWKSDKPINSADQLNFKSASKGKYTLAVGILQLTDKEKPSIKLGVELKNENGWYQLGQVDYD
ncbi:MAG: DUF4832 domain-containing protein [Bacteroidota bacterium]|nr:DUF4832 domain-containing protein [Bacteroidota bacterium]